MAKVMVVDDAAFMRKMLKFLLVEAGHEVVAEAANGRDAVHTYVKYKPDLVTMDVAMPELDGIGAVRQIRKFDPLAKIIMCSSMGQTALIVDAISSGAKDFIEKPFQKKGIIETVNKVLDES
ncbi:two-component system, chemotaxis family, response regulator CheY [Paenibacillus sp. 1_12]|uniref:response regulator n=1 Tax=Paenibacillus sp. 1_12 TaxID=1566278 RepID=UPI0008F0D108|nr:response regulator [Paenibacillus sp. 1_12]SFL73436.1 two-component system, chemotaxis family, response regulator CheY [Paenibacillus sp. 1_12]